MAVFKVFPLEKRNFLIFVVNFDSTTWNFLNVKLNKAIKAFSTHWKVLKALCVCKYLSAYVCTHNISIWIKHCDTPLKYVPARFQFGYPIL